MSDGGRQAKKTSSGGFHFLAGLGSGVTSAFLLQPADLLKTRVQQQQQQTPTTTTTTTHTASLRRALHDVLQGPRPLQTLWRGTAPSVIRTGLGSALYFGLLNQMRQHVAGLSVLSSSSSSASSSSSSSSSALPPPKLSNVANLATGALARVAAGFVLNPMTVLKVRYESTHYASYTSLVGAARHVLAQEGPRGFFAGFGATAIRDAPYAGLYVVIYEHAKVRLGSALAAAGGGAGAGAGGEDAAAAAAAAPTSSASVNFVSGVVAATAATTLTNPFDAIKTRLQIAPARYRNLVQAAARMLRDEGVRSMFTGLSLRIGRKALSSALTWTVYEELIRRAESALV